MTLPVRFRPLPAWPHPVTKPRSYPRFKTDYPATLNLLERELRFLDGRNVIVGLGLSEFDIRQDGMPRSNARAPQHPGVELSFDSKFGRLTYSTDQFESGWPRADDWKHNLRAIALSLEALRAVDRYGVSTRGQQYAGWKALPPGIALGPAVGNVDEAWAILTRISDSDPDEVGAKRAEWGDELAGKDLYRQAAKIAHPDTGGSAEDFQLVHAAGVLLGVAS